jgi:hypothetical protein
VGRARAWWNGRVVGVSWSPWHESGQVPSVMVELNSGGATPPSQRGRIIHCGMTPDRARELAAALIVQADRAEALTAKFFE